MLGMNSIFYTRTQLMLCCTHKPHEYIHSSTKIYILCALDFFWMKRVKIKFYRELYWITKFQVFHYPPFPYLSCLLVSLLSLYMCSPNYSLFSWNFSRLSSFEISMNLFNKLHSHNNSWENLNYSHITQLSIDSSSLKRLFSTLLSDISTLIDSTKT